jgi:predicted RNA-binding Zn ribbon-like protein
MKWLVISLLLCACGSPVMGTVKAKDYTAPYWASVPFTTCAGYKPYICTTSVRLEYRPATQYVQVCNEDDGCVWVWVDATTWNDLEVGNRYSSED